MQRYQVHQRFIQKKVIRESQLNALYNFVCGNLLNYTHNYLYWQEQYELVKQLNIVINWKQRKNIGKTVEKIINDNLIS